MSGRDCDATSDVGPPTDEVDCSGSDSSHAGSRSGSGSRGAARSARSNSSSGQRRRHVAAGGSHAPSPSAAASSTAAAAASPPTQLQTPGRTAATEVPPPEQLRALRAALESAVDGMLRAQQAREATQLPAHVARAVMRDPMGRLLAACGLPVAISLRIDPASFAAAQRQRASAADRNDWKELAAAAGGARAGDDFSGGGAKRGLPVPATEGQVRQVRQLAEVHRLVHAARLREQTASEERAVQPAAEDHAADAAEQGATADAEAAPSTVAAPEPAPAAARPGHGAAPNIGAQVRQQLSTFMAAADERGDAWGTTKQSAAEIARQIAEANSAANQSGSSGEGGEGGDSGEGGEGGDEDEDGLELSAAEERYADPAAVGAELREMEEIYEVLAKVWDRPHRHGCMCMRINSTGAVNSEACHMSCGWATAHYCAHMPGSRSDTYSPCV